MVPIHVLYTTNAKDKNCIVRMKINGLFANFISMIQPLH